MDRLSRPLADHARQTDILFALLFWAFTYALLTLRVALIYDFQFDVLTVRRVVSTAAGAFAFWLALTWLRGRDERTGTLPVVSVVMAVVPAGFFVLAVRLALDAWFLEHPLTLERNLLWVMVWSGYFGLWISGALAWRFQRRIARTSRRAEPVATAFATPRADALPAVDTTRPFAADVDVWEELIEAMAAEMATLPEADRDALLKRLADRTGYELADDMSGGVHNARVALTVEIMGKIAGNKRGADAVPRDRDA